MKRTVILTFPGAQILDITGPAAVFAAADDLLAQPFFAPIALATQAGPVATSAGINLCTTALADLDPDQADSYFIIGGSDQGLRGAVRDAVLRDWAIAASSHARRFGSICSGSLILAAWGLIGERRVASHWMAADEFGRRWPKVNLDKEAIYVEDGPLWTSAGVTAGIDMALAIVERDLGNAAATSIARRLVLSVRRPGTQTQYSNLLDAQAGRHGRYQALISWMVANPTALLGVADLADRAGESLRSFHRNFTDAVGQTPANFVMTLRTDHARTLLRDRHDLKTVAHACGFGKTDRLSRAFQKRFGMTASEYRLLHGGGASN